MSADPRHQLGQRGEELAAAALQRRGYRLLARRWSPGRGDIDLVAEEGGDLVLIEVKTRVGRGFGGAVAAVGLAKQRQLSRLLDAYLAAEEVGPEVNLRFDVVAVTMDQRGRLVALEVFSDAFEYLE